MSNNTELNPMIGGDTILTDDLGTAKVQGVKIVVGSAGTTENYVSSTFPLPITTSSVDAGSFSAGTTRGFPSFGVYSSSPRTVISGKMAPVAIDQSANVQTTAATRQAGERISDDYTAIQHESYPYNIGSAGTTVLSLSPCRISALTLNTPVAGASLALYNGTSGTTGTAISTTTLPGTLLSSGPQGVFIGGGFCTLGLVAITTGTANWTLWIKN